MPLLFRRALACLLALTALPTLAQTTNTSGLQYFSLAPSQSVLLPTGTGCLQGNGAGTTPFYSTCPGGGSGSVTSIAIAVPAWLTVSGSPVTTSGTITIAAATGQTAHLVVGTGSSGTVGLESLATADLPSTAVTPGSYTSTNLTVDSTGRITAAANGTGGGAQLNVANTWTALQTFGTDISIGGVTASGATGTGNVVFSASPTLTTPNLGTPSAIVLTNATGFPTLNQDTTGNAGTATALATAPSVCTGGQAAAGIAANGNASGCFSPSTPATTTNTVLGNIGAGTVALTAAQVIGVINSGTANAQTGTTYTLALTDANNQITMNNASANTLTFPLNSSVAFPLGTLITVQQLGAGTTSIALTSGVTVQQAGNITYASLGGQYGFEQFQQVATNVWQLVSQQLGDAKFTVSNSSTCATPAATAGGNTGGTITMAASGTTNTCTLIITPGGGLTAVNTWVGSMGDRSQLTLPVFRPSASSTTTLTFTVPAAIAANDVLSFDITAE